MFYVYDETGKVTQSAFVSNPDEYRQVLEHHNLTYIETDEFFDKEIDALYVENGVLKERPIMDITVQIQPDGRTINLSNIPVGAVLSVDGVTLGVIDDGDAELTFGEPGRYSIILRLEPYKFWVYVFEAVQ